jgi:low affinity Fe/Cu permease
MAKRHEAAQDEIVRRVAETEQRHTGIHQLDDDERADIIEALAQVRRGDAASEDEAAATFARLTA